MFRPSKFIYMKKSPVKDLVDHLKNIYSLPKRRSSFADNLNSENLRQQVTKQFRTPWRANGVTHQTLNYPRLPIGDLDNWEILRINMVERSYVYPKSTFINKAEHHGLKIPSVGREFTKYDSKDKDGHYPYLYEGDLPKVERIREKIYSKPFLRTNTVKNQLFGFPSK